MPLVGTFMATGGQFLMAVSRHFHGRLRAVFHGRRQIFDGTKELALYHSKGLASAGQRIVRYANACSGCA
jgi:hypothetical protein